MSGTTSNRPPGSSRRRLVPGWALVAAFVLVPLVEIYVIVQVGQTIGVWWTIGLLILASIIGSWLIRREGGRAWRALTEALQQGRMPARELADGALILIGGTLMLTPGFVTDAAGVLLILPFTRPVARAALTRALARRLVVVPMTTQRPGPATGGSVVQGEVVDDA